MNTDQERIAILETKVSKLDAIEERTSRISALESQAENTASILKEIVAQVTELNNQLLKHKGFIGGVMFTVTALWTIIALGVTMWFKK